MRGPRALFVDFDGTICGTEHAAQESWRELYAELGGGTPGPAWDEARGRHDGHLVMSAELAERIGRPLTEGELARRLARKAELADAEPLAPGVASLLAQAARAEVPAVVVSNSSSAWLEHHLTRLGVRGDVRHVVSGETARKKPHPDLYLAAARLTGVPPEDAVAVEDSPSGVAAARAAGVWCLGVGPAAGLAGADAVVPTLEGVDLSALGRAPAPHPKQEVTS